MPFEPKAYQKLRGSIRESVITLILHHSPKHKIDEIKLEESVKYVSPERQPQCLVLLKAIKLLDLSVESLDSKALKLNALAYFIHQKIKKSYEEAKIPTSPTRSNFYNSLTTSIGLTLDNAPNESDLSNMYSALSKFLRSHVYLKGDPRQGYLIIQEFKIADYVVEDDIKEIESKLSAVRLSMIDQARKLLEQSRKPQVSSSYFGGLFGGNAPQPTDIKQKIELQKRPA